VSPPRRARRKATGASPAAILAPFPAPVRRLANQARRLILDTVPTAVETPYPGWRAFGYRDPQSGYFCGVFPQRDHVRLYFEHGAALPDPRGLLEGQGKQVRHVTVRDRAALGQPGVRQLLAAALVYGAT